jgi:hypothetical protein
VTEPERPCIDCGYPTMNDERCRECDIDHAIEGARCPHCGRHIWNELADELLGLKPYDHAPDCPERGASPW